MTIATGALNVNTVIPLAIEPVSEDGSSNTFEPEAGLIPSWQVSKACNSEELTNHNGRQWKAKWWTQGNEPGKHGVWLDVGAASCPWVEFMMKMAEPVQAGSAFLLYNRREQ